MSNDLDEQLIDAAECGDLETIRRIVAENPQQVNGLNLTDTTPLHCAITQRQDDTVRLLIELGANVNARDSQGRTPLHCAAQVGSGEFAKLLIEHGADLESTDCFGETPLTMAAYCVESNANFDRVNGRSDEPKAVDYLLQCGSYYGIEAATKLEDEQRVRELLESAPTLLQDLPKSIRLNVMFNAIYNAAIMNALLEYGANPNECDPKGVFNSPAITRVYDLGVAEALLKHGADPNALHSDGHTRLRAAKRNGETDMAELLIRYGGRSRVQTKSSKPKKSTSAKKGPQKKATPTKKKK